MSRLLIAFALIFVLAQASVLSVSTANGGRGGANANVITDGISTVIVNGGSTKNQAEDIVRIVDAVGLGAPSLIFLTDGNPDHFYGVVYLRLEYPETPVQVANEDIRQELLANIAFLDQQLPIEVLEFDWENTITLLPNATRIDVLAESLWVDSNFPRNQALFCSVVYYPDEPFLITGDLLYIQTHMYFGRPLNYTYLNNWKGTALNSLTSRYGARDLVVYPGYGPQGTTDSIQVAQNYLDTFSQLLLTCTLSGNFYSMTEIADQMQKLYPSYLTSQILQFITTNPAWPLNQKELGCSGEVDTLPTIDAAGTLIPSVVLLVCLFFAFFF